MKKFIMSFCCVLFGLVVCAQNRQLSGVIRDPSRLPVEGVTIKVKGASEVTTSDAKGHFEISVPTTGAVLEVSSVGFSPREVKVGTGTFLEISLDQNATELTDVVVTALGIRRERRALGYAVAEVKGEDLTRAKEINLGNALAGRVAGLNVSPTATGAAGSTRLVIRGATSVRTDNQPLYVINGIPIDNTQQGSANEWGGADYGNGLSSINPDDIESISVLKGGAAAALYGSRAGQGVILITTKSSRTTRGLGVDASTSYTMDEPLSRTDWQQQYGGGTRGNKPASTSEARENSRWSWGGPLDGSVAYAPDGLQHPYSAAGDNFKRFYNNGSTFMNTVALSGGSEKANFRFSAGNVNNNGIIKNSGYSRKTFALAINGRPNQRFIFESTINYFLEGGRNRSYVSDSPRNPNGAIYTLAPNIDVNWLDPGYDSAGYESPHFGSDIYAQTPFFVVNKVRNFDKRDRLFGSASVTFNVTDHLYLRGRAGVDNIFFEKSEIQPTGLASNLKGSMNEEQEHRFQYTAEGVIGYRRSDNDFSIDAFAGSMRQHYRNKGYQSGGSEFKTPFLYFMSNTRNRNFNNTFTESEINSLFASADFGFRNYIFVTLTGRQDWFSTLNKDNNSIFYPSIGASFIVSDAFTLPAWMNYGKIRASWANVGGGDPRAYATVLSYNALGDSYLGQPMMATNGSVIPNSSLKPFNVKTTEFGFEMKSLDTRLGIDATYYVKKTTNDIVDAAVSATSGYRRTTINVGEMSNRGIELMLTYAVVRNQKFNWEISYNFAHNKNRVDRISQDNSKEPPPIDLGVNRDFAAWVSLVQGEPFGVIRAFTPKVNEKGEYVLTSSGLLQRGELIIAGYGVSPTTMGLNQNISFGNFSASLLIDAKFGGNLFSSTNYIATYSGLHKMTLEGREQGMQISGVTAEGNPRDTIVNAETYWDNWSSANAHQFAYDASFIKLRSISIGYSLPAKLLSKTPIADLRVSFVARNLAILYSNIPNVDPESNYTSGNAQGLERLGVPITRNFGFTIQARF